MLYSVLLEPTADIKAYAMCNPKEAKSYAELGFAVFLDGTQVLPEEIDEAADIFTVSAKNARSTIQEV